MASEPDTMRTRAPETTEVRPTHPEARRTGQVQPTTYHAEGKSPEQIRDDIERTRADMTGTIDVIQEKLAPERLRAQAREAVREATIGRAQHMAKEVQYRAREAGFSLRETVRNNPLPAAMVAVGLGWLAVQATMGGDGHAVREVETYPYRERGEMEGRAREMEGRAREMAGEARHRAEETMTRVQERAGETMTQAQERAGELAGEVQERAEEVSHEAQRQVERARGRIETMIDENPLAMGAVALAVGAAIGMMLPSTRQEDRVLGEARDTLVHRAEEMAEDTMGKVEQAAEEAQRAAEEEARRQDLTT